MRLLSSAVRLGLRRGLSQGSRVWLALGLGAGVLRLLGRLGQARPSTTELHLAPGQRLEVEHYRRGEEPPRPRPGRPA